MPVEPSRQEKRLAAREAAKAGKSHLVATSTQTTITHSGPLPPADELAAYERIAPGFAERLLSMVERQSAHRIEIESLVISSQQAQSARGQHYGLIIGLAGIVIGAVLSLFGHEWVGGVIAGTTVTGLVSAFVIGKVQQGSDLASKRPGKLI